MHNGTVNGQRPALTQTPTRLCSRRGRFGRAISLKAERIQRQRSVGHPTPVTFRATVALPLTPVRGKARMAGNTGFSQPCGHRRRANGTGFLTADTPLKSRLLRARRRSCARVHVEAAHRVPRSWRHPRQRKGRAGWRLTISAGDIPMIGRLDGTGGLDRTASGASAPSYGMAEVMRLRLTKPSGASDCSNFELLTSRWWTVES